MGSRNAKLVQNSPTSLRLSEAVGGRLVCLGRQTRAGLWCRGFWEDLFAV